MPDNIRDVILAALAAKRDQQSSPWKGRHIVKFNWDVNETAPEETTPFPIETTEWDPDLVECGGDQTHAGERCRPQDTDNVDDQDWQSITTDIHDAVVKEWKRWYGADNNGAMAGLPQRMYDLSYEVK